MWDEEGKRREGGVVGSDNCTVRGVSRVEVFSGSYLYGDRRLSNGKVGEKVVLESGEVLSLPNMALNGVDEGVAVEVWDGGRGGDRRSIRWGREGLNQGVEVDKVSPAAKRACDLQVCWGCIMGRGRGSMEDVVP